MQPAPPPQPAPAQPGMPAPPMPAAPAAPMPAAPMPAAPMPAAPAAPMPAAPVAPAAPAQPKHQSTPEVRERLSAVGAIAQAISAEVQKVIIGKVHVIENVLINILSGGNLLFEDYPGLAKTLMTNTFADALGCDFKRVQFTPDLLPADITGTNIYDAKKGEFTFKPGPLFCNLLLADEINRAPPKTQAALLEAMQEKQVTIGTVTHKLPAPFIVMATQNPVEQEGTYPLPEAQIDRFMLKTIIDYPSIEDEQKIVQLNLNSNKTDIKNVVNTKQILSAQEAVMSVYMDEKIEKYILDLIFATRYPERYKLSEIRPHISFGSSPRGSINLATAAKCYAFLKHRGFVIPEDVRSVIYDVLRHRIGLTYEAEAENIKSEDLISQIINQIEVP